MLAASSSAPLEAAVATAAKILLELSQATTDRSFPPPPPPPLHPVTEGRMEVEDGLKWPSALKGKRSRRDHAGVKERRRMQRLSPSSPFELSGASTSGSSSPEDLRMYNPASSSAAAAAAAAARISGLASASSSKTEYNGRPPLSLRVQAPRSNGSQRPRKKMRLPEMQEEVRSLEQENKLLLKEAEQLQTACVVLSKENRSLEARLDTTEEGPSIGKNLDQASQNQGAEGGFNLPDLNFPPPVDL